MQDPDEVARSLADLLVRVAHYIQPMFPHHAEAIFGEVVDTRLTGERWARVGKIISSINSVPGTPLVPEEHDRRNMLLYCESAVTRMAGATAGVSKSAEAFDFVGWRVRELTAMIPTGQ